MILFLAHVNSCSRCELTFTFAIC